MNNNSKVLWPKKNLKNKKIQIEPHDYSVIDEDPELTSSVEYNKSFIQPLFRWKHHFSRGSFYYSIINWFTLSHSFLMWLYPYLIQKTGLLTTISILFLSCLSSYFSSFWMLKLKEVVSKKYSFQELLSNHIGIITGKIYSYSYFLYNFCVSVVWIFFLRTIIIHIYKSLTGTIPEKNEEIIILIWGCVWLSLPYMFLHSHKAILIINILMNLICFIFIVMISFYFSLFETKPNEQKYNLIFPEFNYVNVSFTTGSVLLSIQNQNHLYDEVNGMRLFTIKRGKKIWISILLLEGILYSIIIWCCVFCFSYLTQEIVDNNPWFFLYVSQKGIFYDLIVMGEILLCVLIELKACESIIDGSNYIGVTNRNQEEDIDSLSGTSQQTKSESSDLSSEIAIQQNEKTGKLIKGFIITLTLLLSNMVAYLIQDLFFLVGVWSGIISFLWCYGAPIFAFLYWYSLIKNISKYLTLLVLVIMLFLGVGITINILTKNWFTKQI